MSSSSTDWNARQAQQRNVFRQSRNPQTSMRGRRQHLVPAITLILLGKMFFIGAVLLLISTAIAYENSVGNIVSIIVDLLVTLLSFINVLMLAYLIFNTRGEGHYYLTFWNIIDTLFGNMVGNIGISTAMWKIARITQTDVFTITTHEKSPLTAFGELSSYSLLMLNGGGVVRQFPSIFVSEFVASIQLSWNIVVIVIIFAAADATLAVHTDEDSKTST